jgi:hypothetical protein
MMFYDILHRGSFSTMSDTSQCHKTNIIAEPVEIEKAQGSSISDFLQGSDLFTRFQAQFKIGSI